MAELIRLARSRDLDEMAATYAGVAEWLSEPEHEGFMRALWEWLRRVEGLCAASAAGDGPARG